MREEGDGPIGPGSVIGADKLPYLFVSERHIRRYDATHPGF